MKEIKNTKTILNSIKKRVLNFFSKNGKLLVQIVLTFIFFLIAFSFIKEEQSELYQIKNSITEAKPIWILVGFLIAISYIFLQGLMYVVSFSAIGSKITLKDATALFLKRNFISVFIPAGGITSLYFFTEPLLKKGTTKTEVHLASAIYGFVGIVSVVLFAIPLFLFSLLKGSVGYDEWLVLGLVIVIIPLFVLLFNSLIQKGKLHRFILRSFPKIEPFLIDLQEHKINRNKFLKIVLCSVIIDAVGIAHIYIAMKALQFESSLFAATMAYVVAVIFLIISPFLRGLGAVEVSMGYILIKYGFNNMEAVAITLFYRFFEFWLPLFAGIMLFVSKIQKLLMRIIPALLLLILGIVNIVSAITPAIHSRLHTLKDFLPLEAIHTSNYLVLSTGLFLLVTSAFMLKGLRIAWWFAVLLSVVSLIGNLTKAIDFEESIIALLVLFVLIATRKEYYVKTNPRLGIIGLQTSLLSILAVLIYGVLGFYFFDKKHFNIDFSLEQSIQYTIQNYFLIGSDNLHPIGTFATHFLASLKISGFLSFCFLIYTLVKPSILKNTATDEEKELVTELMHKYGNSSLGYFKTYFDKLFFISESKNAFISYRLAGNFAVALENPVGSSNEEIKLCILEFDKFCYDFGLRSIYYRIPQASLKTYTDIGKKHFFLGQAAVVDLREFHLEGQNRKSLRNALKKITDLGLQATINEPPIKDGLLQQIKAVSDQWLQETSRKEILFSQGIFLWEELKKQTIITVENNEGKILAFINIIPDYAKDESTYDLIRKTDDAPNGIMDFIMVALFNYLKSKDITYVDLGLAPMSGIENPQTIQEKSMKYAYEKVRSFSHYKGLRNFKDKFSPSWHNQYIVFNDDYDLIQIPRILTKVIKP
ncbi:phosphatidylglycerol lysyltransferase domain-containing protein [Flavobacterium sp. ov086]|uniref:phosphatidylglycerol lysyltransferase domain-containing protein n=1 Tax=Flavobacterium sp. ov086 TaxID=1761785 RepID=UPI000B6E31B9|nr:phosphatidylglycerol lysyltransferase domain-containing protein [Flavobacterium sp. ov086]SNR38403.1 phosphatidylglycerol lysyltransferase [Flavobacterium sp. ov086]